MYKMSRIRFPLFSFSRSNPDGGSFMNPRNGILAASLLLALMSGGIALPQDTQSPKQDMKDAGQSIKNAAKDIGRATRKTAKQTEHKVKHGTKKAVNKSAEKTRQTAKKVEDKTKSH